MEPSQLEGIISNIQAAERGGDYFEIIWITKEYPEAVNQRTILAIRKAYGQRIPQLLKAASQNIDTPFFGDAIHLMREAELIYDEARRFDFNDISEEPFKEPLKKAVESQALSFDSAYAVLTYIKESKLDAFRSYIEVFENLLPSLAEKEQKRVLSLARRTAKRAKKGGLFQKLDEDVRKLRFIQECGYGFPREELEQIKTVAYRKSVAFYEEMAKEVATQSPDRAKKYNELAGDNARRLDKIFSS